MEVVDQREGEREREKEKDGRKMGGGGVRGRERGREGGRKGGRERGREGEREGGSTCEMPRRTASPTLWTHCLAACFEVPARLPMESTLTITDSHGL